jgi:hypothetical protein
VDFSVALDMDFLVPEAHTVTAVRGEASTGAITEGAVMVMAVHLRKTMSN